MKSNVNMKSGHIINIYLILVIFLIFLSVPIGQAVSAERTFEKNALTAGNGTNVTVVIRNDNIQQSLSLKESIPPGWSLTRISDDAQFKATTNEWLWPKVENNTVKTVKYRITVPSDATSGVYNINGNITTGEGTTRIAKDTIEITLSPTSGNSSNLDYQTTTATPEKNKINATVALIETTDQPTVTVVKQTIAAPVETMKKTPIATTENKSPGFGIMFSLGIIAAIYILRKMK